MDCARSIIATVPIAITVTFAVAATISMTIAVAVITMVTPIPVIPTVVAVTIIAARTVASISLIGAHRTALVAVPFISAHLHHKIVKQVLCGKPDRVRVNRHREAC